jgi:hypothetical protein
MAAKRKTAKPTVRATAARSASASATVDRSLGALLRTGAIDRIVPDVTNRLESGRRRYVTDALASSRAELEVLEEERKRLDADKTSDPRRARRLDRLMATVQHEVRALNDTATEIERGVEWLPGGWTVVGRVLRRDGSPAPKAMVEFVSETGEVVKELGRLPTDPDGHVRHAYSPEVVERVAARKIRVAASVRTASRVPITDSIRVAVTPDGLHQFDLRIDDGE